MAREVRPDEEPGKPESPYRVAAKTPQTSAVDVAGAHTIRVGLADECPRCDRVEYTWRHQAHAGLPAHRDLDTFFRSFHPVDMAPAVPSELATAGKHGETREVDGVKYRYDSDWRTAETSEHAALHHARATLREELAKSQRQILTEHVAKELGVTMLFDGGPVKVRDQRAPLIPYADHEWRVPEAKLTANRTITLPPGTELRIGLARASIVEHARRVPELEQHQIGAKVSPVEPTPVPRCGQTWEERIGPSPRRRAHLIDHDPTRGVSGEFLCRVDGATEWVSADWLRERATFIEGPTTPETPREELERVIRIEAENVPSNVTPTHWMAVVLGLSESSNGKPVAASELRRLVAMRRSGDGIIARLPVDHRGRAREVSATRREEWAEEDEKRHAKAAP